MEKLGWFDVNAFQGALDATRVSRRFSWRQVAAETGVSASTLTRMTQGKRPDLDGMAALVVWSGLSADDYIGPYRSEPSPLGVISSYIWRDENLSFQAAVALDELVKATYERLRN